MLAAIAELVGAVQAPASPTLTESKPQDTAERRQVTVMFSESSYPARSRLYLAG
jgi:hypothetical protein